jgi:hypothetical protein
MNRLRFRIGLRLALLLMALACVLSAYLRASLDLRRETVKSEILKLDERRFALEMHAKYVGNFGRSRIAAELQKVNAQIAEMQRRIGIEDSRD